MDYFPYYSTNFMMYILDFEGEPMKDEDGELLPFYNDNE